MTMTWSPRHSPRQGILLPGVGGGGDLALDPPLAEPAGDDDPVEILSRPAASSPSTSSAWIHSSSILAPWA